MVSVVSYQVEVSALGRSLVQRNTTDCGVPKCDRESSIMKGPGPTMAICAMYINSEIFAHSSLLQPQGKGSLYADSCQQSFFDRQRGRTGCRPVLHYQRSVASIMESFMKQILLKN